MESRAKEIHVLTEPSRCPVDSTPEGTMASFRNPQPLDARTLPIGGQKRTDDAKMAVNGKPTVTARAGNPVATEFQGHGVTCKPDAISQGRSLEATDKPDAFSQGRSLEATDEPDAVSQGQSLEATDKPDAVSQGRSLEATDKPDAVSQGPSLEATDKPDAVNQGQSLEATNESLSTGTPGNSNSANKGNGKCEQCFQYPSNVQEEHLESINKPGEFKGENEISLSEGTVISDARLELLSDEQRAIRDGGQGTAPKASRYKEDVERLLSVLESLAIRVEVKPYVRDDTINCDGNENGPRHGNCQDHRVVRPRPIDLTHPTTTSVPNKPKPKCRQSKCQVAPNANMLYCKNLFLKDRKNNFYLVIAEESATVDLKVLKHQLNAARNLSFADGTATEEIIGERSGGINPFVAMRDSARDVRFALHQSLQKARLSRTLLAFHPLDSKLQIDITVDDLEVFLRHHDKPLEILLGGDLLGTDKSSGQEPDPKRKKSNELGVTKRSEKNQPKSPSLQPVKERPAEIEDQVADGKDGMKRVELEQLDSNMEAIVNDSTGNASITKEQGEDFCKTHQEGGTDTVEERQGEIHLIDKTGSEVTTSGQSKSIFNPTVNGKPFWKIYFRKGKLKSLLKKTDSDTENRDSIVYHGVSSNDVREISEETSAAESVPDLHSPEHQRDEKVAVDRCLTSKSKKERRTARCADPQPQNMKATEPCQKDPKTVSNSMLPEITQFYAGLSNLGIEYRDIYLPDSSSSDIGPSLGCKCFFLKDRKQNFFLVITHEFYELDHGRLKKALKPRKKLDQVEIADILDALGVEPFRVTPFSCTTDRARASGVLVFMTEKIQPPEIVLCIQHPFSEGRRLVMRSGELQRYLLAFTHGIGVVEEKKWHEKYDRIFTRFRQQTSKRSGRAFDAAMPVQDLKEKALGGVATGESSCLVRQSGTNKDQNVDKSLATTESPQECLTNRHTNYSFLNACRQISRVFFDNVCMTIQRIRFDDLGYHCDEGSSVDDVSQSSTRSTESESGIKYEHHENTPTFIQDSEVPLHTDGEGQGHSDTAGTSSADEEDVKHSDLGPDDRSLHLNKDSDKDDNSLIAVDDIIRRLQETGIEFVTTNRYERDDYKDALERPAQSNRRYDLSKPVDKHGGDDVKQVASLSNELLLDAGKNGTDLTSQSCSVGDPRDEDETEDVDNVETCSTTYLCDAGDNHYLVVGGEFDFITTKRFCRRFHLSGILKECRLDMSNLTTSPFSVALAIEGMRRRENPPSKIYVILFSSLYIDPETLCDFRLTRDGHNIRMTSSEFENYVRKSGMEVWYMP